MKDCIYRKEATEKVGNEFIKKRYFQMGIKAEGEDINVLGKEEGEI